MDVPELIWVLKKELADSITRIVLKNDLLFVRLLVDTRQLQSRLSLCFFFLSTLSCFCSYVKFAFLSQIEALRSLLLCDLCLKMDNLVLLRSNEQGEELSIVENSDLVEQLLFNLGAILLDHFKVFDRDWVELHFGKLLIAVFN